MQPSGHRCAVWRMHAASFATLCVCIKRTRMRKGASNAAAQMSVGGCPITIMAREPNNVGKPICWPRSHHLACPHGVKRWAGGSGLTGPGPAPSSQCSTARSDTLKPLKTQEGRFRLCLCFCKVCPQCTLASPLSGTTAVTPRQAAQRACMSVGHALRRLHASMQLSAYIHAMLVMRTHAQGGPRCAHSVAFQHGARWSYKLAFRAVPLVTQPGRASSPKPAPASRVDGRRSLRSTHARARARDGAYRP